MARQEKLAQAPKTATTQSTKQVDVLAQKYPRAGNLSKASQTIWSTLKPALKPGTLDKLKAKNPPDSTDFDSRHWPTTEDWSEKYISKYMTFNIKSHMLPF